MNLSYGPEHERFRSEVRSFLEDSWIPDAKSAPDPEAQTTFRRLATEAGYLYRNIPKIYGGSEQDADLLKGEIIREEFTRVGAPLELRARGISLLVPTLLAWGTDEQKAMFIPKTLTGEFRWSQGYSEPGAGSDLASLRTRAELIGDRWIINGQKVWSSEAHKATHMFMLVRTELDRAKHDSISYLLVRLDQPGITIRPLQQITGESEFNEVFFDNAETDASWIVGERGKGWAVSRTTLKHERTNLSGVHFHTAMFHRLVQTAKDTQLNGKPAIQDQAVRDRLAKLHGWLLASNYSTYRHLSMTAAEQDSGLFPLLMKLNGSNMAREMHEVSREIIGDDFLLAVPGRDGSGKRQNKVWARQTMTSLRLAIAGGSSNIQRNIIAERGLGLPRDSRTAPSHEKAPQ